MTVIIPIARPSSITFLVSSHRNIKQDKEGGLYVAHHIPKEPIYISAGAKITDHRKFQIIQQRYNWGIEFQLLILNHL